MTDAAFHLTEEFISEDLDYYFSGERDKNNQIRPSDDIYSMTPMAHHLSVNLDDDKVGNFFYPSLPNLLDRVYIGISVPLFASNWGASFLLELLKIIKPGGVIILPVYPEGQAQEKGYWSRSFLENIFLSRQRWTGFSNVRAENDGVMSLGVGRKWPDPIPSTAQWFYQQRANLALDKLIAGGNRDELAPAYAEISLRFWANYTHCSVVERIILDTYGAKSPISVSCVSKDYGLMVTDLLLSPYINVTSGSTFNLAISNIGVAESFASYFSPITAAMHEIKSVSCENIELSETAKVICLIHALSDLDQEGQLALIDKAWSKLESDGILILHDEMPSTWYQPGKSVVHEKLISLGELSTYSSIVASKINDNVEISHYSSIQEGKLRKEKQEQTTVFKVIQKK
ncbi:MAG: hypothetical protein AAF304_07040 [Pseudomonadota bacterium]